MEDKKLPNDLNSKKDMSVDDIINDVMKKKSMAKDADKMPESEDERSSFGSDDSYLLDFDSDSAYTEEDELGEETSDSKSVADLIAEAIEKKTMQEENSDPDLDQKFDEFVPVPDEISADPVEFDVENEESTAEENNEGKKKKLTKKRITSVIVCYVIGIVFLLLAAGVSAFGYFTGLLQRGDTQNKGTGQLTINPANSEDLEKEDLLRQQLKAAQESFMSDDNVTNILIIGEDIRDTTGGTNGNTDVMMLCSINNETKEVTLTSFMRDMYVEIADTGGTYAKLNSAYATGGAELTMKTLKNNFGIDVDKYVLFNFYTFIDIVDACGGVDIRISDEEAIGMQAPMAEQNKYLKNKKGTDYLTEGGTYHMNGNQALGYSRLRYVGNADFERTERQRRVVTKIAEKARDMSLVELSDLLDKVLRELETNLTDGEIAYLLYHSASLLSYDINQLRIPADGMYTNELIRTEAVLVVDLARCIKLFQETVYGYSNIDDEQEAYEETTAQEYYGDYNYDYNSPPNNEMNMFY